jgi:hypothetical protein
MKNTINALVVLSAFAITTTVSAQTKAPNSSNYKQQNLLLSKKNSANKPVQINISNDNSTNPLANHRNYKARPTEPREKILIVGVGSGDRHRHYKQKNLLTKSGYEVAKNKNFQKDSLFVLRD